MNKFFSLFIDFDTVELKSKNIVIAILLVSVVGLICIVSHQKTRLTNARTYIIELEEQIGDSLMDTIGSGDAYDNYYNY